VPVGRPEVLISLPPLSTLSTVLGRCAGRRFARSAARNKPGRCICNCGKLCLACDARAPRGTPATKSARREREDPHLRQQHLPLTTAQSSTRTSPANGPPAPDARPSSSIVAHSNRVSSNQSLCFRETEFRAQRRRPETGRKGILGVMPGLAARRATAIRAGQAASRQAPRPLQE
jgi:hypothetical protein